MGVAYADKFKRVWLQLEVPDGSTVRETIEFSGTLDRFPEIDLETQRIGVFGKLTRLDVKVDEGARVEIHRETTADPELVERRDTDGENDDDTRDDLLATQRKA